MARLFSPIKLLIFLLATTEAMADDATQPVKEWSDSIKTIDEVIVTANRKKEIIKSQSLSGAEIESLNSTSVADALRFFSGVQVKDFGGIGGVKTVNIRSMGSNHTGVYYDGIKLGNAQNGQIDLGRYSLDNIEEIELYNGQKSNILQSASDFGSSGSIYIRTRRPQFKGNEYFHLRAGIKGGSFGLINPSVVYEYKLSRTTSISASASYTYADGRYKFRYRRLNTDNTVAYDTTATRHGGDVSALRTEVSVFGFLDHGTYQAKVYYYDSGHGVPGAIVNNVFRKGERQWDRNFMGQGTLEYLFSQRYHLKVNAKWAWDYMKYLRDDPRELYVNNRYYQQEAYFSAAQLFRIDRRWDISMSTDFIWNTMNANMSNFLFPWRTTEMVAVAAAYSSAHLKAQTSLLATLIQDHTRNRKPKSRDEFQPALFVSWRPLLKTDWTINGFIKRSMRMPTFNDLYYTEIGNKDLKPEFTMQFDIGSGVTIPIKKSVIESVSFNADVYYNRVTDKIIAYPAGQQFRWTMLNLGEVDIKGVELASQMSFRKRNVTGSLRANYTFQRSIDVTDSDDSFYHHQIPYIPRHSGSVAASVRWEGWSLNYSFIYTGERYNAQENIPENFEQPWYTHDASLNKDFRFAGFQWRGGLEVNNLFNQAYEVVLNYPMPGRNYKLSLKLTI